MNFLPNLVASNYASIGLTSFSTNAKEVCILETSRYYFSVLNVLQVFGYNFIIVKFYKQLYNYNNLLIFYFQTPCRIGSKFYGKTAWNHVTFGIIRIFLSFSSQRIYWINRICLVVSVSEKSRNLLPFLHKLTFIKIKRGGTEGAVQGPNFLLVFW